MIPNCVPCVAGNEIKYLREAVDTGWLSPVGPFVDRFETMFAEYHGVDAAAAVTSGTAAVHVGLIALGIEPGDLVLCPALTFIGSVNPIRYCGADPVFLDIDEDTLNLDPECLAGFLHKTTERRKGGLFHISSGRHISVLMVVHLYGNPASMEPIMELCREFELPVLEDTAESLGARYNGQLVGTFGDVGCFSFNGNKVITTGGGGMVIARKPEGVRLCKHLSTQAKSDGFEFIHDRIGYNYRLSNLCAAVGLAQMEHLDEFIERKRNHAEMYASAFSKNEDWTILREPVGVRGIYWMVLVRNKKGPSPSILEKARRIADSGIGVRPIWKPMNHMPMYRDAIRFGGGRADIAYQMTLCLPSSVGLLEDEISQVSKAFE